MGKALYRVRSQTKYLTTITVVKVYTKYLFYEKKSASVSSDLIFTIYYEFFSTFLEPSCHFYPKIVLFAWFGAKEYLPNLLVGT
jgi:hypothetical protein